MRRISPLWALLSVGALASCVDGQSTAVDEEDIGEAPSAIVSKCDYLDPALFAPLAPLVSFPRELMITDRTVIDDGCRTTWGVPCGPSKAVWTFGKLMTRMAGTVPPQVFVADWLHSWEVGNVVNGFPVPARPGIRTKIINPWLVASGCPAGAPIVGVGACPLDLTKAPFRLLGISNRVDLSDAGFGAGEPGEARFIFGATANGDPILGAALQYTVILEYKLPSQRGGAPYNALNWATDWHVLSDAAAVGPIGSFAYLTHLEGILNDITMPGVEPGNPNLGNAIGQVRTNEIEGGPNWKLREYHLRDVGAGINAERLRLEPLLQTPDDSKLFSASLDTFLFNNSLALPSTNLMDFTHVVPSGMSGGESTAPFLWAHSIPGTLNPLERHHFGLDTCNGCHQLETNTAFVHLAPRGPGGITILSGFLSTSDASTPSGTPVAIFNVVDPAGSGAVFQYSEPWRRVCESTRILNGDPNPWTRGNGAH